MKSELKNKLDPLSFYVTQENGTEPPFKNTYWNHFEKGIYVDIISKKPLFSSLDKYDSHCGWPSFTKPIADLKTNIDRTHGMIRTEVRSRESDSHLGHLFPDGPKAFGGNRYCINSAALEFVPYADLEKKGYGDYIKLFEED